MNVTMVIGLEMNHIFGFRIFDMPKTLHSTLHQDSIQLIIMRLKSGLNPVGTDGSIGHF